MQFSSSYWQERYQNSDTPWDIGYASTPLVAYFDTLLEKSEDNTQLKILIPGGGSNYEAEYLYQKDFKNVFVLDIAKKPLEEFEKRCPDFPKTNILYKDFFEVAEKWDLIIEQTFFCALPPHMRGEYAKKMHELLNPNGKLVGLLFDFPLQEQQESPPFGGSKAEYEALFEPYFHIKTLKRCYNSIKPRQGSELFIQFVKTV